MKKTVKIISLLLFFAIVLSIFSLSVNAAGQIKVNGTLFSGTLEEAIVAGKGGTVEISGTVYTRPIGDPAEAMRVDDVVISGINNAKIVMEPFYFADSKNKLDVITLMGSNITMKNLTVDAGFKVDFPIRIFPGCSNLLIENVVATSGTRGAVNVMSNKNIKLINVKANSSIQGGFYFENAYDCTNITFENCSTSGNLRAGVLIRNGYGPSTSIDLSGITCYENNFVVEDRMEGTIGGQPPMEINIIKPPKNSSGNPINTSKAVFYQIEKVYHHIRYGMDDIASFGAYSYIDVDRYGFKTRISYIFKSWAESDVRPGETIVSVNLAMFIIGMPVSLVYFAFNTVINILNIKR